LTTDGGANWKNCSPVIKELPGGAWVPQIVASEMNKGEAWVVVNNYRQNDYAPYLFHTSDYGKKWSRVAGPTDVEGYVLSFAQDPEEARLQFLGTEHGLWVSIDGGALWTKWTVGYPTVPTMDLEIHPREHDLVIGTFGRAAYILDDIRPLRALARNYEQISSSALSVFEAPVAYLADTKNAPGYYFSGDAYFEGENRPWGARISYFVNVDEESGKEKKDSLTIRVMDEEGNTVRTLKTVPEKGLNRTIWRLDRKGARVNFTERNPENRQQEPGGGGSVLPGLYHLQVSYRGDTVLSSIKVEADPRRDYDMEGMKLKQEKADLVLEKMRSLEEHLSSLRDCKESYELVNKLAGEEISEELKEATLSMKAELDRISKLVFRDETVQGIYSPSDAFYVKLRGSYSIIGADRPLTGNQMQVLELYLSTADEAIDMIDHFLNHPWQRYKELVIAEQISLID
jgi:hypothetical protein